MCADCCPHWWSPWRQIYEPWPWLPQRRWEDFLDSFFIKTQRKSHPRFLNWLHHLIFSFHPQISPKLCPALQLLHCYTVSVSGGMQQNTREGMSALTTAAMTSEMPPIRVWNVCFLHPAICWTKKNKLEIQFSFQTDDNDSISFCSI